MGGTVRLTASFILVVLLLEKNFENMFDAKNNFNHTAIHNRRKDVLILAF